MGCGDDVPGAAGGCCDCRCRLPLSPRRACRPFSIDAAPMLRDNRRADVSRPRRVLGRVFLCPNHALRAAHARRCRCRWCSGRSMKAANQCTTAAMDQGSRRRTDGPKRRGRPRGSENCRVGSRTDEAKIGHITNKIRLHQRLSRCVVVPPRHDEGFASCLAAAALARGSFCDRSILPPALGAPSRVAARLRSLPPALERSFNPC